MKPDLATEAIEAERAQIGHEIHDALLPLIFAASASLQNHLDGPNSDHGDRENLLQAHRWLRDALQTGRTLLTQVYPPELKNTSWVLAAQHATTALIDDDIDTQWQIDAAAHAWPPSVASTAYRIVVEAVRNAVRHGKATQIKVVADAQLLSVVDNGCGFDPAVVAEDRYGIRSMKGRAALIGGSLDVDSQVGGPTEVRLSLTSP
ncbi:MAG: hypothetical protein HKN47_26095 [Pirellulaceae bacterium]|nr:hypothetical protein [Pirellulaceae bacterium]